MGAALEPVTVQHERAKAPRIERISRKVKAAIDVMVFEGLPRDKAAEKAGISDHGLYKALCKPPVLAYLNSQQRVLRTSAAARSIARVDGLADDAESEHVRLDANKFLLGIEGISPVQRTENTHVHAHVLPGLQIVFAHRQQALEPGVIEGQCEEISKPNGLPVPIAHPALTTKAEG